jgi:hypothetical protein
LDTAFCLKDGEPWDAETLREEAAKQPAQWLIDRRPTFMCRGCEEKARFINYSGKRIAHFGVVQGREHHDDCDFRTDPTGGLRNNGAGAPLPVRPPAAGAKEVRYDAPGPLNPTSTGGANGDNNQGRRNGGNQASGNAPLHETTGLRTLLKNLRNGDDYPPEHLFLDVPARGTAAGAAIRATDYFRRFADFTQDTAADSVTRAYWGQVSSAQEGWEGKGKETLWINCNSRGSLISIRLEYAVKDELLKALGITKPHELNNSHVIVEGITKQGPKKLTIPVTDITKIAFLPKR